MRAAGRNVDRLNDRKILKIVRAGVRVAGVILTDAVVAKVNPHRAVRINAVAANAILQADSHCDTAIVERNKIPFARANAADLRALSAVNHDAVRLRTERSAVKEAVPT